METKQSILYKLNQNEDNPFFQAAVVHIPDGTNTISLSEITHANRTVVVSDATLAVTLPEATGSGDVYKIVMGVAASAVTIVTADTTNCHIIGGVIGTDVDTANGALHWPAAVATVIDTITLNGGSKGGVVGDWIALTDIATDRWLAEGFIRQSGGAEATPFSAAV